MHLLKRISPQNHVYWSNDESEPRTYHMESPNHSAFASTYSAHLAVLGTKSSRTHSRSSYNRSLEQIQDGILCCL